MGRLWRRSERGLVDSMKSGIKQHDKPFSRLGICCRTFHDPNLDAEYSCKKAPVLYIVKRLRPLWLFASSRLGTDLTRVAISHVCSHRLEAFSFTHPSRSHRALTCPYQALIEHVRVLYSLTLQASRVFVDEVNRMSRGPLLTDKLTLLKFLTPQQHLMLDTMASSFRRFEKGLHTNWYVYIHPSSEMGLLLMLSDVGLRDSRGGAPY